MKAMDEYLNPKTMEHDGWTLDPKGGAYAEALGAEDPTVGSYLTGLDVLSGRKDLEQTQTKDPLADLVLAESAGTSDSGSDGTVPTIRTGFEINDNWDV